MVKCSGVIMSVGSTTCCRLSASCQDWFRSVFKRFQVVCLLFSNPCFKCTAFYYGGWSVPFRLFAPKQRHAKKRKDATRKDELWRRNNAMGKDEKHHTKRRQIDSFKWRLFAWRFFFFFFRHFVLEFRLFVRRISLFRLFAWRLFVFFFRMALFRGQKTK